MARPKKDEDVLWKLFVVRYWVPFPASEYGGLQLVIATSPEECEETIKKLNEWEASEIKDAEDRIKARVKRAIIIPLAGTYDAPHLVTEFTT